MILQTKGDKSMVEKTEEQKILADDEYAIKWLNGWLTSDYCIKMEDFNESALVLVEYVKKCTKELAQMQISSEISKQEIKKVQEYLNDIKFFNKCRKLYQIDNNYEIALGICEEVELEEIRNLSKEEKELLILPNEKLEELKQNENEEQVQRIYNIREKIKKINRFYNMMLKYAHTAKVTFISQKTIENLEIKNNSLKQIILTSAILHDVGRFYQAQNYDTFDDYKMKGKEKEGIDGHAEAGYYYSIMDLFRLNCHSNISETKLMNRIISAFVVRYHQKNNNDLKHLELMLDSKDISSLKMNELMNLIEKIYQNAPLIECSIEHRNYIKKFIYEIIVNNYNKGTIKDINESFGMSTDTMKDLVDKVAEILDQENEQGEDFVDRTMRFFKNNAIPTHENDKELNKLVEEVKEAMHSSEFEKIGDESIKFGLQNMADYDVAKAIFEMFLNKDIFEPYKPIFSFPLSITLDADKIDILNQRALKTYPTVYNPEHYEIKINSERILKNYKTLNDVIETLNITDESEKQRIVKDNIIRDENITEESIQEMLYGDLSNNLIKLKQSFKIPSSKAYEYYNSKYEEDNIEIILRKDDEENFYKYNGIKNLGKYQDDNTVENNTVRAILWTINQFVFTNMRTKQSFQFIKDNKFIERIYEQYPKEIRDILKPYIVYTLYYIDKSIENLPELYTSDRMKDNADEIYNSYNQNKKQEYEEQLNKYMEERNRQ